MNADVGELYPEWIQAGEVVVRRKTQRAKGAELIGAGLRQRSLDPVPEVQRGDVDIGVINEINAVVEKIPAI